MRSCIGLGSLKPFVVLICLNHLIGISFRSFVELLLAIITHILKTQRKKTGETDSLYYEVSDFYAVFIKQDMTLLLIKMFE